MLRNQIIKLVLPVILTAAALSAMFYPYLHSVYSSIDAANDLVFVDDTDKAGIRPHHTGPAWKATFSASVADTDNDGDDDLFVNNHERYRPYFYVNNGDGTFAEAYESVGLLENAEGPVFGRPALDGMSDGFIIWLDASEAISGTWHVRWIANSKATVAGEIAANTAIVKLQGVGIEDTDYSRIDKNTVRIESIADGELRGLDFTPKFPESTLQFQLKINGSADPTAVYIGPDKLNPKSVPFDLSLGDRHGTAWGDFDNDGNPDLFVTRGAMVGELKPPDGRKLEELFQGSSDAGFVNVIGTSNIRNDFGRGRDAQWVDYDRDGRLDIYLSNFMGRNLLYRNRGDGSFVDVSVESGLALEGQTHFVWADFNDDGYADVLFSNPERLFFNKRDGTFVEVTDQFGVVVEREYANRKDAMFWGSGAAVADFDNDGDLDIFVASGKGVKASKLFENQGYRFADITNKRNLDGVGNVTEGIWGDFDNDGHIDLYTVGPEPAMNRLFKNEGGERFVDVTDATRLGLTDNFHWELRTHSGGVATWLDYDDDGFIDLFLATRRPKDAIAEARQSGTMDQLADLVHRMMKGKRRGTHFLFRNTGNDHHWLKVSLAGTQSNRSGYGAKVFVKTGDVIQMKEAGAHGKMLFAQNRVPLHFGVGMREKIDAVEVVWTSGQTQTIYEVDVDQTVELIEPQE